MGNVDDGPHDLCLGLLDSIDFSEATWNTVAHLCIWTHLSIYTHIFDYNEV